MRSNFRKTILLGSGVLLIAMALGLVTYNLWTEARAGETSQEALNSLKNEVAVSAATSPAPNQASEEEIQPDQETEPVPDYILNPEKEMPEKEIDGIAYIGYLEIPALELELPVITKTTYPYLRVAPCRNYGSPYQDNFVIAAHNYETHFGNIKTLEIGDLVIFTDMDGNVFTYQVAVSTILQPNERDVLWNGEWPLSLFTCTIGGRSRVTVRCEKVEE